MRSIQNEPHLDVVVVVVETGLLLNFYAVAPTRYKRGVVRSLVYRVFYSCSSWKLFHGSLERAKALIVRE